MKFHLLGDDFEKVEIEVVTRSHPNTTDYWDINWIDSKISVEIPGYVVQFHAALRTDEISDFLQGLKLMYSNLRGKAALNNLDNAIFFECEMDHLGKLKWLGETCYPAGYGALLKFEFSSDQSYLKKLIKELEAILSAFPVIGNP
ncbi:WapI family immunity protein [Ureibacillus sinduriensis]|uniref:Uncharacterized protein n=1 Tax=Ureibacillus sinduriensis BLB-1 = JCM 15800 TaxID=1384057 RepID=A0A0A3HUK3_9BACL|nr:hypothetical protein [Ureibacillus sinduriensis]KGR76261.1 hypothetical protein CD33_06860 [Ureibacillus sinduriensis BLB-1 = JCM 15800]